ncbi:hypothetical protein PHLCEN_2v2506 [Hermanssonia centrifuga]|uniref:Uncharacterized protein n=1 Tax=Hermanssonia centrifuga TaxID=98765 RepID=A0A2R6RLM8_9APHY|nr:hypothetical protein PHLCEN_2v2506 [Hermanssonia centrifuga]
MQKVEFLWVRWFGRDLSARGGFGKRRLHRIGFADSEQPGAFGFLDPGLAIRSVHLIPAFHYGRTTAKLGPSILRQPQELDEDWDLYYVNIFVDRDMFMRFLGGGIGHKATRLIVKIADTFRYFFKNEPAVVEDPSETNDNLLDDADLIAVDKDARSGVDENQEDEEGEEVEGEGEDEDEDEDGNGDEEDEEDGDEDEDEDEDEDDDDEDLGPEDENREPDEGYDCGYAAF